MRFVAAHGSKFLNLTFRSPNLLTPLSRFWCASATAEERRSSRHRHGHLVVLWAGLDGCGHSESFRLGPCGPLKNDVR